MGNLYVVGTTLVYGGTDADNAISISGSDSDLTIADAAGTIRSTVPGFVVSGGTVSGAVPSYIRTIAINGNNGTDTIAINAALSTSRSLLLTADTITNNAPIQAAGLTETGTVLSLGAEIDTNNGGPLGGAAVFDGSVVVNSAAVLIDTADIIDGNVTFGGSITGSQDLTINAGDAGNIAALGPINLSGGQIGLGLTGNNVSLHQVIDTVGVSVLAQNAVTLNGSLLSNGVISILANQGGAGDDGFTQVSGNIVTTSTLPNAVLLEVNQNFGGGTGSATVRGITAGAGAGVTIITASTAAAGGGIIDGNGPGSLNVNIPGDGTLTIDNGPAGVNLYTSVGLLNVTETTSPYDQPVNLQNSGLPLEVTSVTTQGNVNISNNDDLQLDYANPIDSSYGGNLTLTTTNGGDVALGYVAVGGPSSALTINSAGDIEAEFLGSAFLVAPVLDLTAATGIGDISDLEIDPNTVSTTVTALTVTGGITLTSIVPLTVDQATSQSGPIDLTSYVDLTDNGLIATGDGGGITLSALGNLIVQGGTVSSDTGEIDLDPGTSLTVAANTTVATGGDIFVDAFTLTAVVAIDGVMAAGGDVSIDVDASTALVSVSGAIAAQGTLTIDTTQTSGSSTLLLGGNLTSTGDTDINTGGTAMVIASGTIRSGGGVSFNNSFVLYAENLGTVTLQLQGTITAAGDVVINGTTGGASTEITMSGTTTSTAGGVSIVSNGTTTGDTFSLATSGTISAGGAPGIVIDGSAGDANTFTIGGTLSGPTIAISAAGDATTSMFDVTGVLSAAGGATFTSGTGSDNFVITPSMTTVFTFAFGAGTSSLQIATAQANILQADAGFTQAIVFVPSSGYGQWNRTGGSVVVTPTVP